jgi:hypothetical protein
MQRVNAMQCIKAMQRIDAMQLIDANQHVNRLKSHDLFMVFFLTSNSPQFQTQCVFL